MPLAFRQHVRMRPPNTLINVTRTKPARNASSRGGGSVSAEVRGVFVDYSATIPQTEIARKRFDWSACWVWLPAASMMLVTTISYIDRNTLALLAPSILRDARLSNEQYGFILSGFSIAYML